jgi:hypothetical protein
MTSESSGTDIMPTMGKPPFDMPMSKAPKLARIKYMSMFISVCQFIKGKRKLSIQRLHAAQCGCNKTSPRLQPPM